MRPLTTLLILLALLASSELGYGEPDSRFVPVPGDKIGNTSKFLAYIDGDAKPAELGYFYVVDPQKPSTQQPYLHVPAFEHDHYHPAEFHNGNLYVLTGKHTAAGYIYSLWKFDSRWVSKQIWSGPSPFYDDFRVSPDEKYIASEERDARSSVEGGRIVLMDGTGAVLQTVGADVLEPKSTPTEESEEVFGAYHLINWSGHTLWFCDGSDRDTGIENIYVLNADNRSISRYKTEPIGPDSDFNVAAKKVVYSTYPMLIDSDGIRGLQKKKTRIDLWVYDFATGRKTLVDYSIAREFNPAWIDRNTLQYNDPYGKGRVQKRLGGSAPAVASAPKAVVASPPPAAPGGGPPQGNSSAAPLPSPASPPAAPVSAVTSATTPAAPGTVPAVPTASPLPTAIPAAPPLPPLTAPSLPGALPVSATGFSPTASPDPTAPPPGSPAGS